MPESTAPLICPIFSAAITASGRVGENVSIREKLGGSGLVVTGGPGPIKMEGVPCIGDKCGFWHDSSKRCGVVASAEMLNIVGGAIMKKIGEGAI